MWCWTRAQKRNLIFNWCDIGTIQCVDPEVPTNPVVNERHPHNICRAAVQTSIQCPESLQSHSMLYVISLSQTVAAKGTDSLVFILDWFCRSLSISWYWPNTSASLWSCVTETLLLCGATNQHIAVSATPHKAWLDPLCRWRGPLVVTLAAPAQRVHQNQSTHPQYTPA